MPARKNEDRSAVVETFRLITIIVTVSLALGLPFVLWGVIMMGLYVAERVFG